MLSSAKKEVSKKTPLQMETGTITEILMIGLLRGHQIAGGLEDQLVGRYGPRLVHAHGIHMAYRFDGIGTLKQDSGIGHADGGLGGGRSHRFGIRIHDGQP